MGLVNCNRFFTLLTILRRFFCVFLVLGTSLEHPRCSKDVFAPKNTKKRQKKCQKGETPFSIDPKHIFGSKLCAETPFFVYFLDFSLIFWKFGQNRQCCPKGQNSLFFTIFFNFFYILWYLEGEFRPTGPRHPILGAGFTRGCPGNGLMVKKMKTGQNFTRESDPLTPPPLPPLMQPHPRIHKNIITMSKRTVDTAERDADVKKILDAVDPHRAVCSTCRADQQEYLGMILSKYFATDTGNVCTDVAKGGETECALPAPLDVCDDTGMTPLMICALNGHFGCLILLLEAGAAVDFVPPCGRTALMYAALGSFDCLRELIARGASLAKVDSEGDTALHHATMSHNTPDLVDSFDRGIVRILLKHNAFIEAVNNTGHTPLLTAIMSGNEYAAIDLLQAGACMNVLTEGLRPAFHVALLYGIDLCAECFLERGVSATELCPNGVPPMSYAVMSISPSSVAVGELLLQHGASVDSADYEGLTPLMYCSRKGHNDFAAFLLRHGADVDCRAQAGTTALHIAAESGNTSLCKMLVEHGSALDAQDPEGCTALALSADVDPAVCQILIDAGAQLDVVNNFGYSPLLAGCRDGHLEFVKQLVDAGAPLCVADHEDTPLMMAASGGHVQAVRYLLGKKEVDVNQEGIDRCTALHQAAKKRDNVVVKLLLQHGADKTLRNDSGDTALDCAIVGGCSECCRLLRLPHKPP